jgi:hypothetical protein
MKKLIDAILFGAFTGLTIIVIVLAILATYLP